MPTFFSRVLAGEFPARFVWKDPDVVAFLTTVPMRQGHTLVVPRQEVDQWTHLDPELLTKCVLVAQSIGRAVQHAWNAPRVGLLIAGFELPHMHMHVSPVWEMSDFHLLTMGGNDESALDHSVKLLRAALRELGYGEHVPEND